MICRIVGAGDFDEATFTGVRDNDFLIAADGGLEYVLKTGHTPDLFFGDFDSIDNAEKMKKKLHGLGVSVYEFPSEKDDSDMALSADYASRHGFDQIIIYGGTGGRIAHTLANISLIASLADKNIDAKLIGKNFWITASEGKIILPEKDKGFFSVFAFTDEVRNLTIKNAKYETENITLKNTNARGLSNEFVGAETEISADSGIFIVCVEEVYGT